MKTKVLFLTTAAVGLVAIAMFSGTTSLASCGGTGPDAVAAGFKATQPGLGNANGFQFVAHLQWPPDDPSHPWEGEDGGDYWFVGVEPPIITGATGGHLQMSYRTNPDGHRYAIDYSYLDTDAIVPGTEVEIDLNATLTCWNNLVISDFKFLGLSAPYIFPNFGMSYPLEPVPHGPHDTFFYLFNSDPDSSLYIPADIDLFWDTTWQPAQEEWPPHGWLVGRSGAGTRLGPGEFLRIVVTVPDSGDNDSFIYAVGEIEYHSWHEGTPRRLPFRFGHQESFVLPTPVETKTWGEIKALYH